MTTERRTLECKVCGWRWFPYKPADPRRCPKCASTKWAVGRKPPKRRRRSRKAGSAPAGVE